MCDTGSMFQVTKYAEKHIAEVKQLKDARKGTAPDVAITLKEVKYMSLFIISAKSYNDPCLFYICYILNMIFLHNSYIESL